MLDPRNIFRQPDVVERTMRETVLRNGPQFRVVRLVKNGPLAPCALMFVETRHEPGAPENDMQGTRSPSFVGFLSGEPVAHEDLARLFASGKAGSRHITQAEYAKLVSEIASNRRAGRFDPRQFPYKAVDMDQMALPFARTA